MSEQQARCNLCEELWNLDDLKYADSFNPDGSHRYLQVCPGCEVAFEKDDIVFSYSDHTPDESEGA